MRDSSMNRDVLADVPAGLEGEGVTRIDPAPGRTVEEVVTWATT